MSDYPKPWRIESTSFGESMGYDSRSRIVDANGKHVITIGTGVWQDRAREENLAFEIVDAVNSLEERTKGIGR